MIRGNCNLVSKDDLDVYFRENVAKPMSHCFRCQYMKYIREDGILYCALLTEFTNNNSNNEEGDYFHEN